MLRLRVYGNMHIGCAIAVAAIALLYASLGSLDVGSEPADLIASTVGLVSPFSFLRRMATGVVTTRKTPLARTVLKHLAVSSVVS